MFTVKASSCGLDPSPTAVVAKNLQRCNRLAEQKSYSMLPISECLIGSVS